MFGVLGAVTSASLAWAQADTQPPSVVGRSPATAATGVSITATVTATFNESIQPGSVGFVLRDSASTAVPASLGYNAATRTVALTPQTPLLHGRTYTATLSTVVDLAGNPLGAPVVWSFTTHPGFTDAAVLGGLVSPTAFQFAPDGRVFVAEKSGLIKVFASASATTPTVFADLRGQVYDYGRSGLLGLALDPGFPTLPYVYVLYTYDAAIGGTAPAWGDGCPPANGDECVVSGRLSRLQANGNVMTGAEQVLVEDWYQRYPGQPVGGLAFGPDGALYASAGDGAGSTFVDLGQSVNPSPDPSGQGGALRSQDLTTPADPVGLSGTVIRVHPDTGAAVRQTTSMLVGTPTVDANGVKSYLVTSVFQGPQPTAVRVLEPTNPAPGTVRRHLYVLPVETGVTDLSSTYSDGLEELRLLDVHNRYNLTLIAPSFHIEPWYGDHDTDVARGLESFIVRDLVPFGDSFPASTEIPQRWVLGFSKSGNGALTLILRHPHVFSAAAAWDAPAQFTDISQFKMAQNFGTEQNFDRYEIPALVQSSAQAFTTQKRLWISGDVSAWTSHMVQLDTQMTGAGVLHTFVGGTPRAHHWASGWLEGAVADLAANATPVAPVDRNAQRIVAYGLRSPSRIAFRPGTDELWIADAGETAWEEINVVPRAADGIVENFGWPCYEGADRTPYAIAGQCSALYEQPAAVTPPFYAFNHAEAVVSGDTCAAGGGSISGLTFYGGGSYPAAYQDALFFADASRNCIWVMFKGAGGLPDPNTRATFLPGAATPVDLRTGPGGDLFYADRDGGSVRRISYSTGNLPPTAVIQAGPLSGSWPLTVSFNGSASIDPEGGVLSYAWDLNGDGAFDDSTAAQASFVYTSAGTRTVRLRVTDPQGLSAVAAVVVVVADNVAPVPTITSPAPDLQWGTGQIISFAGGAIDAEDGPVPASSLAWSLILNHCPSDCHPHALQDFTGVAGGSFTAPDHAYPSTLELRLTATDSVGLQRTTSVTLQPRTSTLTFQSTPPGVQIVVGGTSVTTPFAQTVIAGSALTVSVVSPQTVGGTLHQFASWSDGGAQAHAVVTDASRTYTVTFTPVDVTPPVRSSGLPAGVLAAGTTQTSMSVATNENATCRYATTAGVAYASMTSTFATTGGTAHSTTLTGLVNGGAYSFFVRCQDPAGNANPNDFTISFAVAQPVPAGLVAAYSFNEGTGTSVADASGNGHVGTITAATWSTQGRFGNALTFNGTNAWVTVAPTALLNLTTGMTLEAWVLPTAHSANWNNVVVKERANGETYNLYSNINTGVPAAYVVRAAAPGTPLDARGTAPLPLNVWSHLAATYDGATLRLFVNGAQVGSRAVTGALLTSTGVLRIGGNSMWGEFFQGTLDEIRVYNRALTTAEIQADMNAPIDAAPADGAPTVAVTAPANATSVSGTVSVTATASDDVAVLGVQFLLSGVALGAEVTTPPYAVTWDTTTVAAGPYTLSARARDGQGHVTTSAGISVDVANNQPPGDFRDEVVIGTGLTFPTAFEFLPDGRMLITEMRGRLLVAQPNASVVDAAPVMDLPNVFQEDVTAGGERGLVNVVADPGFATNGFVYLFYTAASPPRDRVSRFTMSGNTADPGSELVVWQGVADSTSTDHHGGALAFGPDGKLYISTGDNGDPPTSQSLTSDHGKILRVNKDGTIPPDNPFVDGPGPNIDAIWARGLRNPYRFSFDPANGRMYIGDVGASAIEEVNVGVAGANYGWPTCEGPCAVAGMTNPLFSYPHDGRDAAITGGFVYRGTQFPPSYQGVYFYGDFAQNWIRYLTLNAAGAVTANTNFMPADGSLDAPFDPVMLKPGPDGSLYYVDFGWGWQETVNAAAIRRIRYVAGSQPPVAVVSATPLNGPAPLSVTFSSAGSFDAENQPLTYAWTFGDGAVSTAANPVHQYAQNGTYIAQLALSDGVSTTLSSAITITVGTPPQATITAPADGLVFRAGDVIGFAATATDASGNSLPPSAYSWTILFHHDSHVHPTLGPVSGLTAGTLTIPTSGHDFSGTTSYEIILTVTDASGLRTTRSVFVHPHKVNLTLATSPVGLMIRIDGINQTAPYVKDTLTGFQHSVEAPDQTQGVSYGFVSWSDGGTQTHTLTMGEGAATLTATYQPTTVTLFPSSTTVLTGSAAGGTATALNSDDNAYYTVASTTTGTRTAAWYGSFTGVSNALTSLRVNYKGNNSRSCTQTVAIWNWTTSAWVQLDSRTVSTTEVAISNLTPTGALANYVSGTTGPGDVRVRIQCQTNANVTSRGDLMSIVFDAPVAPPPADTTPPVPLQRDSHRGAGGGHDADQPEPGHRRGRDVPLRHDGRRGLRLDAEHLLDDRRHGSLDDRDRAHQWRQL